MIELGQTVGNYRITAKLGEGGMGAVYLAEHPVIGRKAALKVIHPQHARNADVVARFVNEATAINRIGHEHIVDVTDFGRTPAGDFYFIMEYLEGRSLAGLITSEAPLAPPRAIALAVQIADALGASHAHGVIHRDLKPENIFLITRGDDPTFVKVLDFGLAKLVHGDGGAAAHETRSGVVMGTPYYMSPEQCEGRSELDQRADIYALGVVLFEMLTGKLPFGGNGYAEVLAKQISMRAPSARSLLPDLPEALDVVLHTALAKDPAERFATMAAFREALLQPSQGAAHPHVSIHDDLSGRMRAARPMSRAEIRLRRSPAPRPTTTFDEGAAELVDDSALERRPRRRGRTAALIVAASAAGMGLAAGLTYEGATRMTASAPMPAPPRNIPLTFSSDPDGATVVAADGTVLGATPLSIRVPPQDFPVDYTFRMAGFEPKSMSLIPNVPSSLFALLQAKEPEEPAPALVDGAEPPLRRVATASRRHHEKVAEPAREEDEDDVLAPSFIK